MDNAGIQRGLRVLVVEDEALIGFLLEDMIAELSGVIVGPVLSLATALEAARQDDFDVALVDLNLGGERADEVARVLSRRGIPFALASGGPDSAAAMGQAAVLPKPFSLDQVAATLGRLNAARGPSRVSGQD